MDISLLLIVVNLVLKPIRRVFTYPVVLEYRRQFETRKGYVFETHARSTNGKLIRIDKDAFSVKIKCNRKLLNSVPKEKLMYGESVVVFDSLNVLKAFLAGRSFGNVDSYISVQAEPTTLYLLVSVAEPNSTNPSLRFGLGKVYRSVRFRVKKVLFNITYREIPIRHVTLIAGNDRTQIIG